MTGYGRDVSVFALQLFAIFAVTAVVYLLSEIRNDAAKIRSNIIMEVNKHEQNAVPK